MAEQKKEAPQAGGLVVLKSVAEIAAKNKPAIDDRVSKALAALSLIKTIDSADQDQKANDVLVKCNATIPVIEKDRKEYTGPINKWLDDQIKPENDLKADMLRVRNLRNAWQTAEAQRKKAEEDKIKKDEAYKRYEAEVKKEMQISVETGVAQKLTELDQAIAALFEKMTTKNFEFIAKQIDFKPTLKEEYFNSLFLVKYLPVIMTDEQFKDLVARAKGYWKYSEINSTYVKTAMEIQAKWRAQIMPRVRELEAIEKGGQEAEKLKAKAEERRKKEEAERKAEADKKAAEIQTTAELAAQDAKIDASFTAQIAQMDLGETSGRKKRTYRIDPAIEKDFMKVSQIVSKLIIHVMTDAGKARSVFQLDKNGFPKRDDKGEAIYVDGIAYWLDQAAKLNYQPPVEGLVVTEEQISVAKAK